MTELKKFGVFEEGYGDQIKLEYLVKKIRTS